MAAPTRSSSSAGGRGCGALPPPRVGQSRAAGTAPRPRPAANGGGGARRYRREPGGGTGVSRHRCVGAAGTGAADAAGGARPCSSKVTSVSVLDVNGCSTNSRQVTTSASSGQRSCLLKLSPCPPPSTALGAQLPFCSLPAHQRSPTTGTHGCAFLNSSHPGSRTALLVHATG